jgi:NAD(P)-dependent dehydrogenase (short-subunit alcohol dehydrogenase family)
MATAELAGRTALVTGGGRGIGRAIAIALAQAGAHVAVLARSCGELEETARLIAAGSGRACAVTADVVDEQSVERAISAMEVELGRIDVLVNNAGTIGPIAPFAETASDVWWHSVEVNLKDRCS